MERLIRRPEVERMTGFKRSFLYKMMDESRFPRPVRIGEKAVAWRESDVQDWIMTQIEGSKILQPR